MPKHLTNLNRDILPPKIGVIYPPEKKFFSKCVHYQKIPIKSSSVVSDKALREAWQRLHLMLGNVPGVVKRLVKRGAELHIIGKQQVTSDLPENRRFRGKPFAGAADFDERTRGVGGLLASCGEENLLRLKKDRYFGMDICVHEFAHTIHEFGLDRRARKAIKLQYKSSLAKGLWTGCYAATNEQEFFAESSMWFFGTHGDVGPISPAPEAGPKWLAAYDPDVFSLLTELYQVRQ